MVKTGAEVLGKYGVRPQELKTRLDIWWGNGIVEDDVKKS